MEEKKKYFWCKFKLMLNENDRNKTTKAYWFID